MSVAVYQAAHVGGFLPNYTCQCLSAKLHMLVATHQAAHVHSCLPNCMFHDPQYVTSAHVILDICNFKTLLVVIKFKWHMSQSVSLQYLWHTLWWNDRLSCLLKIVSFKGTMWLRTFLLPILLTSMVCLFQFAEHLPRTTSWYPWVWGSTSWQPNRVG
jgi:hypothetical protein